jgi:hypothetical protein
MKFVSNWLKKFSNTSRDSEFGDAWPRDLRSAVPQRYSMNYKMYKNRGNALPLKNLVSGFIHNEQVNKGDMNRFFTFCLVHDQIRKEGIAGDIAELGVYKGNTSYILANFAKDLGRTAYLFDTFEGFDSRDIKGIDSSIPMQFSDTSLETVRDFVGDNNTVYVKGYFPESAAQIPDNLKFCLVHLDCDLYSPIMSALSYFYPRMAEGGFIVLHDYSSLHWDGAENAADEFFSDKPECLIPLADSCGSVIVRKARTSDKFENWRIKRLRDSSVGSWVPTQLLKTYLRDGWGDVEDWGVWGVGESHTMSVIIPFRPQTDIRLIFDVDAVLLGKQVEQKVTVLLEGAEIAEWTFTSEHQRGKRELIIPLHMLQGHRNAESPPALFVEFRPESFTPPNVLDASNRDTRALGLGLHSFKIETE